MKEAYDLSRKLFRVQKYFHPPTLILNFVVFSKWKKRETFGTLIYKVCFEWKLRILLEISEGPSLDFNTRVVFSFIRWMTETVVN